MAEVIGGINDAITLYQFVESLFGGANGASNIANIRVSAALNGGQGGGNPSGADGTVAQVRLYNENQQILANSPGGYVGSGGFSDFSVSQTNNQQATYVQLVASDDAICIPYISATLVDGSQYGWVGDWGQTCGLDWYFGNVFVDNGASKPLCTWIDADHTNGLKAALITMHLPSFVGSDPHSNNPQSYCGFPAFRAYSSTDGSGSIFRRDGDKKSKRRVKDTRLVISSEPSHNATTLCASETSRGPDFVSTFEGVYCDMETSETLPLCSEAVTSGCFKLDDNSNVKRDGSAAKKAYSDVIHWD